VHLAGIAFTQSAASEICITNFMNRKDLVIAPAGEAFLLLVVGLAGWLTHQPLVFASLGPTAYELIETPHRRSAQPYSIFIGHLTGVAAGYLALAMTAAWTAPTSSLNGVPLLRVLAVVIATALTVFGTILLRASQPAAISTSMLIAMGIMSAPRDAIVIVASVSIMIAVGEPLRRFRL